VAIRRDGVVGTVDRRQQQQPFNTDIIDMSKWSEVSFLLVLERWTRRSIFKVQESNDGAAFTGARRRHRQGDHQLGGHRRNKQAIVCVKAEEMTPSKRYIRAVSRWATGRQTSAPVIGWQAIYLPPPTATSPTFAQVIV